MVSDIGSCNDGTADANSYRAVYGAFADIREWGNVCDGSTVNTNMQAPFTAAGNSGSYGLDIPLGKGCISSVALVQYKDFLVRGVSTGASFEDSQTIAPASSLILASSAPTTATVLTYKGPGSPRWENLYLTRQTTATGYAKIALPYSSGVGYALNDVLTCGNGTLIAGVNSTPCQLTVTSVSATTTAATTAATTATALQPNVLTFASVPAAAYLGMGVTDNTAAVIPTGTFIVGKTSTTITLSQSVTGAGVGNGDTIKFGPSITGLAITTKGSYTVAPVGAPEQGTVSLTGGSGTGASASIVWSGGNGISISGPTGTLTATANSGATSVTIDDATGFASATTGTFGIALDTGQVQQVTRTGVSGNTISFTPGLAAQASANNLAYAIFDYAWHPLLDHVYTSNNWDGVIVENAQGLQLDHVFGTNNVHDQLLHVISQAIPDNGDDKISSSEGWDFTVGTSTAGIEVNGGWEGHLGPTVKMLGSDYSVYLNQMFGPTGTFEITGGSYEEAYKSHVRLSQGVPFFNGGSGVAYGNVLINGAEFSSIANVHTQVVEVDPGYAPPTNPASWIGNISVHNNVANMDNGDGSTELFLFADGFNGDVGENVINNVVGCCSLMYLFYGNADNYTFDPGTWAGPSIETLYGINSPQNWANVKFKRPTSRNHIINEDAEIDQPNGGQAVATTTNNTTTTTPVIDAWVVSQHTAGALTTNAQQSTLNVGARALSTLKITNSASPPGSVGSADYLIVYQALDGRDVVDMGVPGSAGVLTNWCWTALVGSSVSGTYDAFLTTGETLGSQTASDVEAFTLVAGIPKRIGGCLSSPPSGMGTWSSVPGTSGMRLGFTLAAGSSLQSPALGTWEAAAYYGASGYLTNTWLTAANATFTVTDVALVVGENPPLLSSVNGPQPPLFPISSFSNIGAVPRRSQADEMQLLRMQYQTSVPVGQKPGVYAPGTGNASQQMYGGLVRFSPPFPPGCSVSGSFRTFDGLGAIGKIDSSATGSWASGITPTTTVIGQYGAVVYPASNPGAFEGFDWKASCRLL